MTKQEELDALRAFIDSLPADTYIGDWLRHEYDSVQSCLVSDFVPPYTYKDSVNEMNTTRENAQRAAAQKIAEAECTAERIVRSANDKSLRIRLQCVHTLRTALNELQGC